MDVINLIEKLKCNNWLIIESKNKINNNGININMINKSYFILRIAGK